MEPNWLKKSSKKSEVFLIDFGPIFGSFWEHFGGQKMSPGAACGDPRAAPGYLEARRHARGVPPGAPGKRT